MLAWALVGTVVAARFLRWDNRMPGGPARAADTGATPPGLPVQASVDGVRQAVVVRTDSRASLARVVLSQTQHALQGHLRNRAAAAFAIGLPVGLVLLLPQVFGAQLETMRGVTLATFLTPVLAAFGLANVSYGVLAEQVAVVRERGVLKRVRGTPLPLSAYLAGQIGAAVVLAVAAMVLTLSVGLLLYDVELPPRTIPALVVYALLGVGCFASLGIALAALAPTSRSVGILANATLLPLAFISDVFLLGDLPAWLDRLGWVFPLKHLANAVADAFNPAIAGGGWQLAHLGVLALWMVIGVTVAVRSFSWQPPGKGQ
jgi:ABC-2 type transport system permease protein